VLREHGEKVDEASRTGHRDGHRRPAHDRGRGRGPDPCAPRWPLSEASYCRGRFTPERAAGGCPDGGSSTRGWRRSSRSPDRVDDSPRKNGRVMRTLSKPHLTQWNGRREAGRRARCGPWSRREGGAERVSAERDAHK
jgi:hypothetical protein